MIASLIYLLAVCGVGIAGAFALPFALPRWVRLIIGPSLGIIAASEATLFLSFVLSYSSSAIIVGFIFVLLLTVFALRRTQNIHLQLTRKDIRNWIVHEWGFLLILFTIGGFGIYIFATKVLAPGGYGLVTGNGGLWADTAMHAGFTMSLVAQGIPPHNPIFAGEPLIYPFMVNLFAANLIKLGSTMQYAFVYPQILLYIAVITLMYLVGKKMVGTKASILALSIFFLGWGFGFTNYIQDVIKTGDFSVHKEYSNDYEKFRLHNPLTGIIFPERSMLPGLFLGLLLTYFFVSTQKEKRFSKTQILITAATFGISPLWHTHTFIFFGVAIAIWLVYRLFTQIEFKDFLLAVVTKNYQTIAKKIRSEVVRDAVLCAVAVIFALPRLWWFFSERLAHTSFINVVFGWIDHKNPFSFWFWNGGLVIILMLIGLKYSKRDQRILLLPAIVVFFIANFITFQPWDWDNIKLFTWVFFFFALFAGFALSKISKLRLLGKPISFVAMIVLISSGLLSLAHVAKPTNTIYDQNGIELASWVNTNTNASDVFLVDPWVTHPIPGLTGRSIYMGYAGQLWVHGIAYQRREADINAVMAGNIEKLSTLEVPVNYLVVDARNAGIFNTPKLLKVHQNAAFAVYKVIL